MRRDLAVVLGGVALAAMPFVANEYLVGLMTQALIFGGAAIGLDLLVGFAGLPSLGHAAFFGLAGYGTALSVTHWGLDPWLAAGVGISLSLLAAILFAPLAVRFRGLTFLTIMLAFGQVVWGVAIRWTSFTGGENGIPGVVRPSLGALGWNLDATPSFYWFVLLVVVLMTLVLRRIANSPVGLSLLGIRESDSRMLSLGYDIHKRRVFAFVASAGAGAVFGCLSAFFNRFIGPGSLHWQLSAQLLLSVVIGGAGSLWGPFAAGGGIHITRTLLVGETERWPMVLGALYVLTVVALPGGLASLPNLLRRRIAGRSDGCGMEQRR